MAQRRASFFVPSFGFAQDDTVEMSVDSIPTCCPVGEVGTFTEKIVAQGCLPDDYRLDRTILYLLRLKIKSNYCIHHFIGHYKVGTFLITYLICIADKRKDIPVIRPKVLLVFEACKTFMFPA